MAASRSARETNHGWRHISWFVDWRERNCVYGVFSGYHAYRYDERACDCRYIVRDSNFKYAPERTFIRHRRSKNAGDGIYESAARANRHDECCDCKRCARSERRIEQRPRSGDGYGWGLCWRTRSARVWICAQGRPEHVVHQLQLIFFQRNGDGAREARYANT